MKLDIQAPAPLDPAALASVHGADYLAFLAGAWSDWQALPDAGPEAVANVHPAAETLAAGARPSASVIGRLGWFTADAACPFGPGTWAAAQAAAAGAIAAADVAVAGRSAYALTRPPGHHAYPARAGGHCYLNNAALAAERLLARAAARVGIRRPRRLERDDMPNLGRAVDVRPDGVARDAGGHHRGGNRYCRQKRGYGLAICRAHPSLRNR